MFELKRRELLTSIALGAALAAAGCSAKKDSAPSQEDRKAELEGRMSDPDIYKSASGREAVAEYQSIQFDLEQLYAEWEKALA